MSATTADRQLAAALLQEADRRTRYRFKQLFPDEGPLRRALYPRSLLFFAAGLRYRERLFLAANRTSKTVSAAYETTAHLTGAYPAWWPGRRFAGATKWWAAGDTRETTRDILQHELFGARENVRSGKWTGMVPAHLIVDRTLKPGVADCLDTVWIRHVERDHGAPCSSTMQFKSYDQGRVSFQGTSQDGVWLDEEPPDATEDTSTSSGGRPSGNGDIYTECLLRLATTDGILMSTFTPLRGLTPFVDHFLETADLVDAEGLIVNAKRGLFGEAA